MVFHAIIWPFGLLVPVIPLMHHMYNETYETCKLEASPINCDIRSSDCQSNTAVDVIISLFAVLPLLVSAFSIYRMTSIFFHVRALSRQLVAHNEEHQQRHQQAHEEGQGLANCDKEKSSVPNQLLTRSPSNRTTILTAQRLEKAMGIRGILYAGTLLLASITVTFDVITFAILEPEEARGWLVACSFGMLGTLGTLNMLVFVLRRDTMLTAYGRAMKRFILAIGQACCCKFESDLILCWLQRKRMKISSGEGQEVSYYHIRRDLFATTNDSADIVPTAVQMRQKINERAKQKAFSDSNLGPSPSTAHRDGSPSSTRDDASRENGDSDSNDPFW